MKPASALRELVAAVVVAADTVADVVVAEAAAEAVVVTAGVADATTSNRQLLAGMFGRPASKKQKKVLASFAGARGVSPEIE